MRRWILVSVCFAVGLWAQQAKQNDTYYTFDANGRPVGGRSVSTVVGKGAKARTEHVMSVNGRQVPVDSVVEKVIESGPRRKIVERTIQHYDQNGNPTQSEKVRVEERIDAGGRRTTTTTVSAVDLNGRYQVRERRKEQLKTSSDGKTTDATIVVERPSVNGGLRMAERRVVNEVLRPNGAKRDEMIYRPDQGGTLRQAAREITDTVVRGSKETRTKTVYNTANADRRMELSGQTVTDIEKKPDGSEVKVINEYGGAPPGRSIASDARTPQLREQLIVERKVRPDGSVVEVTGVRRTSLSDPNKLGAYQPVSQMVCTGNCIPAKPAADSKKAAQPAKKDQQP